MSLVCVVIGGGAAGFFGAITCALKNPTARVMILEKTRQVLAKVRISGGGRCNVTHACFDPAQLVKNYPRGNKALLGPFHRFQPRDTIEWFEQRGVMLKTEEDGRMFPITDTSQTIIDCLMREARRANVALKLEAGIEKIEREEGRFKLFLSRRESLYADRLLLATGSHPLAYQWATSFGHTVVPPVPSLFTFNIQDFPLKELAGISIEQAEVKIEGTALSQAGPLLITHWGFSGPAALKLSAWGARVLHEKGYRGTFIVNWISSWSADETISALQQWRKDFPRRSMGPENPFSLPRQLWKMLVTRADVDPEKKWVNLDNGSLNCLVQRLREDRYLIEGKSSYKQEFVTCGGIHLDEIYFKTMESRLCPHLYFAGEILDIDGVTGGFNFQNAWTTSWLAGQAMATEE